MPMTKHARRQMATFAVISAVAVSTVSIQYAGLLEQFGVGQHRVTVQATDATGLHERAEVSFRGVQIGQVSSVELTADGAAVVLRMDDDVDVPIDVTAEIHSASAVGEQYVDLVPVTTGPPYLKEGSTISADRVRELPSTELLISKLTSLARSVDGADVDVILTELTDAFGGTRQAWRSLITDGRTLVAMANADLKPTAVLLAGMRATLTSQQEVAPEIARALTHLESATDELVAGKEDLSRLLPAVAPLARTLGDLIATSSDDLALVLHDLVSTGEVVKLYLPGIEQIAVLYPPTIAALQAATGPIGGADEGAVHLELRPNIEQPPTCFQGFLPIKNQRDFNDQRQRPDIPDDLYCRVPQDDPRATRGARNSPCMNVPGRRAASVEECLGKKIGSTREPLQNPVRIRTYDPASGRVVTGPDTAFYVAGLGKAKERKAKTWQQLVMR